MKGIGFDINPLSLLIAQAKLAQYDIDELRQELTDIDKALKHEVGVDIPTIPNMCNWYDSEVTHDLGRIRHVLMNQKIRYRDFFTVVFAHTCRHQSFTKKSEFKRIRVSSDLRENFRNQAISTFLKYAASCIKEFSNARVPIVRSEIYRRNSMNALSTFREYDLVVTSPPYGDSSTTVAYGQYSSFGNEWTKGLNEYNDVTYRVDTESLGGRKNGEDTCIEFQQILDQFEIFDQIFERNPKRADDVKTFFEAYMLCVKNIVAGLAPSGTVCLVVGNRTVAGLQIPMDEITAQMLSCFDLRYKGIFVRNLSNKVMPPLNSPTNEAGKIGRTMATESVVVFER